MASVASTERPWAAAYAAGVAYAEADDDLALAQLVATAQQELTPLEDAADLLRTLDLDTGARDRAILLVTRAIMQAEKSSDLMRTTGELVQQGHTLRAMSRTLRRRLLRHRD